ncbi:MAG: hypothetical protein J6T70_14130 [Bacteroidales bacterium]|nr:hypothetical protein [Bacteroidales bacterium]
MKLIVLQGPENSGKTTTLKIVYEQLKKWNLLETHCFKYYDSDGGHRDFRDVLLVERQTILDSIPADVKKSSTNIKEYCGADTSIIAEAFSSIDLPFLNEIEANRIEDYIKSEMKKINDFVDDEEDDFEDSDIDFDSVCDDALQKPDVKKLISDVANLCSDDLGTLGIVLEGDYGFVHKKTRGSTTHHSRSLYNHLWELRFCDTVICACSILAGVTTPSMKPANCVAKFIIDYVKTVGSITFYVLSTVSCTKKGWKKKIATDTVIANQIVSLI